MIPEDEPPKSEGVQNATGEEQRAITTPELSSWATVEMKVNCGSVWWVKVKSIL